MGGNILLLKISVIISSNTIHIYDQCQRFLDFINQNFHKYYDRSIQ